MTDRKKPGVAFWATLMVVVMLVYALALGPACWISSHLGDGRFVSAMYQPVFRLWWNDDGPDWNDWLHRYVRWGAKRDWNIVLETRSGRYHWGWWPIW
jgi:hypothetical protein